METITHEKTPDAHSSIVGGSSASRILGCPGSVDLLAKIPEAILNESSSYADEGTGLHEVMAYLVDNDIAENDILLDAKVDELWERYKLDDARMWDAVLPAYRMYNAFVDELYDKYPGCELRLRLETRVEMPGIEDAWGSCDLLICVEVEGVSVLTVAWDWKMGQRTPYYAIYHEPDGTSYVNEQLQFYARAAKQTNPDYFGDGTPVELVICWPRGNPELSRATVTQEDLEDFRLDLVEAVEEALSGNARKAKGSYCRFAKCKAICPLHLNGAEAMAEVGAKLEALRMRTQATPASVDPAEIEQRQSANRLSYAEALATMLDLAEILEPYIKEAQAQAHTFMEAGGDIPGHKLVPKKAAHDGWADDKETDDFLSRRKLSVEERRKPWVPITPAAARKVLKAKGDEKGVKLLEKHVKPGVSSGTTIARSDDPREAVLSTPAAVKALADKIASLGSS